MDNQVIINKFINDIKKLDKYSLLTEYNIKTALLNAFQLFFDNFIKDNHIYNVFWHNNLFFIKRISPSLSSSSFKEVDFTISKLKKKSLKQVLKIFYKLRKTKLFKNFFEI